MISHGVEISIAGGGADEKAETKYGAFSIFYIYFIFIFYIYFIFIFYIIYS